MVMVNYISGTPGNDGNLRGTAEADVIDGGAGNDYIVGLAGDDILIGGDGDDDFNGGLGADIIIGGLGGSDRAFYEGDRGFSVPGLIVPDRGVVLLLDPTDDYGVGGLFPNEPAGGKTTSGIIESFDYITAGGTLVPGWNEARLVDFETDATGDLLFDIEDVIVSNYDDWVYGRREGNGVALNAGNDIFDNDERFAAFDFVDGGPGDDRIWTGGGDDTLIGGLGDDWLFGEEGIDTAVFAGNRADYEISPRGDGRFKVVDLKPEDGDEGTDELSRIEFAAFADRTLPLSDISHDLRMEWFDEADLGMFLHWGLYSVLGGEWEGDQILQGNRDRDVPSGEWILLDGQIPECEYAKIAQKREYDGTIQSFNPTEFDANTWMRAASDAGMEYVVVTAKHHDGFSLWDSDFTDYDVANSNWADDLGSIPDPLGELKAHADAYGLKFGIYYSIWDWHHPNYGPTGLSQDIMIQRCAEYISEQNKERYVEEFMKPQIKELIDRYDPDMLWMDGQWDRDFFGWNYEDGKNLHDFVFSLSPDIIVNNRFEQDNNGEGENRALIEDPTKHDDAGPPVGDFFILEQHEAVDVNVDEKFDPNNPGGTIKDVSLDFEKIDTLKAVAPYWQATVTMNDNWGYSSNDGAWKKAEDLFELYERVSDKGGSLLLNVGPKGSGAFPEESLKILEYFGEALEAERAEDVMINLADDFSIRDESGSVVVEDTVGNEGNLLLNFGPDAEGRNSEESADLFSELGRLIDSVWSDIA
jgi:alpha-L-fucosidase